MKLAQKGHTNKKPNPENKLKFERARPNYRNSEKAIRVLGTPDTNGNFSQRVAYEHRGEELRRKLLEDIIVVCKCTVQERREKVKERIKREEI